MDRHRHGLGKRRGGRVQRDLDDAAHLNDADPQAAALNAERAAATAWGRTRRTPQGDVYTLHDVGALPDTVLDDHLEDL